MAIITSYPDDALTTDDDKFLTSNSSGTTVLTPAANINKYVGPGWTIASDAWSFSSYNSTTKIGVINAATGAQTRYSPGMKLKFTQPTLGIKFAKIISVGTTTITIQLAGTSILANEAISLPFYSFGQAPNQYPTTNDIQASELATNAITLGYAQITSNFVTSSTTAVQIPGLSVSVTIPAGGRRIKITGYVGVSFNSNISTVTYSLWDGTVGSGTQIQLSQNLHAIAGNRLAINMVAVVSPSAGSKTYNLALTPDTGTETVTVNTTFPAFILVEAI